MSESHVGSKMTLSPCLPTHPILSTPKPTGTLWLLTLWILARREEILLSFLATSKNSQARESIITSCSLCPSVSSQKSILQKNAIWESYNCHTQAIESRKGIKKIRKCCLKTMVWLLWLLYHHILQGRSYQFYLWFPFPANSDLSLTSGLAKLTRTKKKGEVQRCFYYSVMYFICNCAIWTEL